MITPGPLTAASAAELNQALRSLRELIEGLSACVSAPLGVQRTGPRFQLRLGLDQPFLAKITGGTNPYSWKEVMPGTGGTFVDVPGGGTGELNAYAADGAEDVAADTIVEMHRGYPSAEGQEYFFCPCGGGSGGAGAKTCDLAGLRTTDCLEATGPQNAVELKYDATSTHWKSTVALTYPGGSGLVEFWYASGFHLSVGGAELAGCGDGCFTGGALTGLTVSGSGTEACTGAVLKVCVKCKVCTPARVAGYGCCIGDPPWRMYAAFTGFWDTFKPPCYDQIGVSGVPLDYDPSTGTWKGQSVTAESTLDIEIGCGLRHPNQWGMRLICNGSQWAYNSFLGTAPVDCDPYEQHPTVDRLTGREFIMHLTEQP